MGAEASFGLGFEAGGLGEFAKLGVGDFVDVDEEAADGDWVDGAFLGVEGEVFVFFGAAGVGGSVDPNHAFGCFWGGIEEGGEGEEEEESGHLRLGFCEETA